MLLWKLDHDHVLNAEFFLLFKRLFGVYIYFGPAALLSVAAQSDNDAKENRL